MRLASGNLWKFVVVLLSGKLGGGIISHSIKTRYCRTDARLYASKVHFKALFRVSTLR